MSDSLTRINHDIVSCDHCPRLRRYCTKVARIKRRAYRDQVYWGKPVPSFGDPTARLLVIGLAPAAHGGNRTGRVFTGDRSADFLFRALHRAGFANQPTSVHRQDGLTLTDVYITAVLHCAPPDNKPERAELDRCRDYLVRELIRLSRLRAVLALGRIACDEYLNTLIQMGWITNRRGLQFRHGGRFRLGDRLPLLFTSYHPSQQNTQTGRLTAAMFDRIFLSIKQAMARSR